MTTLYLKLSENWADYDERKRQEGGDPLFFSCDEAWEIFYLAKKVNDLFPTLDALAIFEVIAGCSYYQQGETERRQFLVYILHALQLQLFPPPEVNEIKA